MVIIVPCILSAGATIFFGVIPTPLVNWASHAGASITRRSSEGPRGRVRRTVAECCASSRSRSATATVKRDGHSTTPGCRTERCPTCRAFITSRAGWWVARGVPVLVTHYGAMADGRRRIPVPAGGIPPAGDHSRARGTAG